MTRPRSNRYEEGAKKPTLGKFERLAVNLRLARYNEEFLQKQKEKDAEARKDPYWDKIRAAREKASKRRRMKFRGPGVASLTRSDSRPGLIRTKKEFWILVPKLSVKNGVGQVVNYRAKVKGYALIWHDSQPIPGGGKKWKRVAYEYHMLCYRDTKGDWHIHEQTSGMPFARAATLDKARREAWADYLAIQANCSKTNEGKSFAEVIAEQPEIESFPVMETSEAMKITVQRLNEKKAKREQRRVATVHHRQKFDGITDLDSRTDV